MLKNMSTAHIHERDGKKIAQVFDRIITQQKMDGRTTKGRAEEVMAVKQEVENKSPKTNSKGPKKQNKKKKQDDTDKEEEAEVAMQQTNNFNGNGNRRNNNGRGNQGNNP